MSNAARAGVRTQLGLTLVEMLISVVVLAVFLVPALQALHSGFIGAEIHTDYSGNHYRLVSRLETVLSESFATLEAEAAGPATPSSYSDAGGTPARILVFIAAYDADNTDADDDPFTGTEDDLLWVRVAIENSSQSLASLATR